MLEEQGLQRVLDEVARQFAASQGDCRRLFHGRGGCFPGFEWLVVDLLPPTAVVRVFAEQLPAPIDELQALLMALPGITGVVLQYRGRGRQAEPELLAGEVASTQVVSENGLKYEVRPLAHQNSGLFLDMREGRAWVREQAQGARVLNLFAYTCAFSVAALAGAAQAVVNLDMSSAALAQGRRNHQLNGLADERVSYLSVELLRSWSRVRRYGPYDLVIIDPPSFQKGSFVAERDYRKVLRRLPELTAAGARVLACHNDPACSSQFLQQCMAEEAPGFVFERRLPQPADFPEQQLEAGLKVLLYRKEAEWR